MLTLSMNSSIGGKMMKYKLKKFSSYLLISVIIGISLILITQVFAAAKTTNSIEAEDNGSSIIVNTKSGLIYTINKKMGI